MFSFSSSEYDSFMLKYARNNWRRGTATHSDVSQYNQSVVLGVDVTSYTDGRRTITFTSSSAMMWLKLEDGQAILCNRAFTDFKEVLDEIEAFAGKVE